MLIMAPVAQGVPALTNGHVQQPAGPDDREEAVNVGKDVLKHLGLSGGRGLRLHTSISRFDFGPCMC